MIRASGIVKDYPAHGGPRRVLDGVSFSVLPGERLAVLGRNGAGKSTLVRIVGGLEHPSAGHVERSMSLSWPLGFHGGFQGSLTGIDNIKFIARIYNKNFQEILDYVDFFSELGSFLRQPVKTYSSGMRARLAFGLSLAIDFDCYLVDEVIFVGDQRFHAKCREYLFERNQGRAMIIVSHDRSIITEYCNQALVLHRGRGKLFDSIETALDIYAAL
jgi:capsular polysaccharide transport system ATP-binding protein